MGRALVVLQFAVCTGLLIGALVVSGQLHDLRHKDMGFRSGGLAVVDARHDARVLARLYRTLAADAQPGGAVERVSVANMVFGGPAGGSVGAQAVYQGASTQLRHGRRIGWHRYYVSPDFVETMGMEVVEGRPLSGLGEGERAGAALVNESFVRLFGLQDPVGGSPLPDDAQELLRGRRIAGVVRDIHLSGLQTAVEPATFAPRLPEDELVPDNQLDGALRYLLVRLGAADPRQGLALVEQRWQEAAPGQPFRCTLVDASIEQALGREGRWAALVRVSALVALLVACLGVLGMAALTTAQRTREIGLRKVVGASVPSVVALLGARQVRVVAAASLLAWPPAYWAAAQWLGGYAYRVALSPWLFVGGSVLALALAWAAAGWHTVRAALANPVDALRQE